MTYISMWGDPPWHPYPYYDDDNNDVDDNDDDGDGGDDDDDKLESFEWLTGDLRWHFVGDRPLESGHAPIVIFDSGHDDGYGENGGDGYGENHGHNLMKHFH